MKKKTLVIASVLKPVNDTRLFEKFGLSISQTNKYEVNIIGFCSKKLQYFPSIHFYPLFNFPRNSWKRLLSSWKYYKTLLKLKPDIIIVTTSELLLVTVVYKILFGAEIYYDIQENYYRNIRYTNTYPKPLRLPLATFVRSIEYLTSPFVEHYFLAEKGYLKEIRFAQGKQTVIENKFKPLIPIKSPSFMSKKPLIRLLYTGTISENYGIWEAINFTNKISRIYPEIRLIIAGYAADADLLEKLVHATKENAFFQLKVSNTPLPHETILNEYAKADFALLPYQPDKSIENCFPTKIWEYMAYKIPMIIQNHKYWVDYPHASYSCIAIDFKNFENSRILAQMLSKKFYQKGAFKDVYWENEELTLLHFFD